ncbi:MAG: DUF3696 domain-containing protein [Colwellia sp.]|jgi:Uncharacterized conserved protein
MIEQLYIQALKSFKEKRIDLKPLTLLAGLNNSGKSTFIQSIRMYLAAFKGDSALLEGYGGVSDIRSNLTSSTAEIKVGLKFLDGSEGEMVLAENSFVAPQKCPETIYISADRFGPKTSLPMSQSLDSAPVIGDQGEFVIDYIQKLTDYSYLVPENLIHKNSQGKTFEYALEGWLTEIAPGVEFKFNTNPKADIAHTEVNNFRPTNVGFGLSYTLPIIAAALGASAYLNKTSDQECWVKDWEKSKEENGRLLILENPEAHLHPQGQTAMGRLIALVAASGVQVVVETHSDHLMDGIRIAVKEQELNSEDAVFHYLSKDESGETVINTPKLDGAGKLDSWPAGFFDQTLKNRAILAKRNS